MSLGWHRRIIIEKTAIRADEWNGEPERAVLESFASLEMNGRFKLARLRLQIHPTPGLPQIA